MAFWKKIYKSRHTGKEIDAAVDSASKLPSVSGSDEGKVLTVDDEGNFVAAEAASIPSIEITQEEIGSILIELATDLNSATGDFGYKVYTISDADVVASVGAKIAAAHAKGTFANLSIYGMGTMGCYVTGDNTYYSPVSFFSMQAINKSFALSMASTIVTGTLYITVLFALATEVTPK